VHAVIPHAIDDVSALDGEAGFDANNAAQNTAQ